MGTGSTVKFYDEVEDQPILSVYQQYDGYISGVGHDLANFLKDKKIVNGYNLGQTMELGYANGVGCLAAQYVANSKKVIGGFYLTHANDEQEYNYKVRVIDGKPQIEVDDFKGTPEELLNYNP
jgi:hypothetical protein